MYADGGRFVLLHVTSMYNPFHLFPGSPRRASWLNPPTEGGPSSSSTQKPGFDSDRPEDKVVHDKSNVLLIGPTGSGTIWNIALPLHH